MLEVPVSGMWQNCHTQHHAPECTLLGDCGVHSSAMVKSNEYLIDFCLSDREGDNSYLKWLDEKDG